LTGEQGVIIPSSNIKDLMLKQEIVEANAAGLFNVYAVEHAEQAMEILSGLPAGITNEEGIFPEGTFNFLIQVKLAEWIALRLHYAGVSIKSET
ncbi:MAG: Lon protease family protein, partial [Sedimenticola sp.]|nr:Lon protease family protein [Sedimenticola sp.]